MQLVPFKPFSREISMFEKEMEKLWKRFFGGIRINQPFTGEWTPTVEVSETMEDYILRAELPGLETEDINVSLSDNILIIKGKKKKENEEKGEDRFFSERYYGAFQRSFQLPTGVKTDEVEANFDKGILKIRLAKKENTQKKEIEVKIK